MGLISLVQGLVVGLMGVDVAWEAPLFIRDSPGLFHPQKVYEIEDFLLSTPAGGGQHPLLCTRTAPYALSSARTTPCALGLVKGQLGTRDVLGAGHISPAGGGREHTR